MKWTDVDLKNSVWTMPQAERAKGTGGALKLPAMALDIIRAQPRLVGNEYVFVQRKMNLERAKAKLDAASGISGFTLHDLRRTAPSSAVPLFVPISPSAFSVTPSAALKAFTIGIDTTTRRPMRCVVWRR